MNKESKSKFNLWLSERPESFLPSDEGGCSTWSILFMKRREVFV